MLKALAHPFPYLSLGNMSFVQFGVAREILGMKELRPGGGMKVVCRGHNKLCKGREEWRENTITHFVVDMTKDPPPV